MSGTAARTATEIETKFDVPPAFVMPDLSVIKAVDRVGDPVVHELDATYFDTAGLDLLRNRITLRRRLGGTDEGWHVKRPRAAGGRTETQFPLGRSRAQRPRAVPDQVRATVEVVSRGRELHPVVRLRTTRVARPLLDADGGVLIEVAHDTVRADVDGRTLDWEELEVELVSGEEDLLALVGGLLEAGGAEPAAGPSKLARALGDRAPAPVPLAQPDLSTSGGVLLAYAGAQVARLREHDPRVRVDAEDAVHQMRVASRRLRSILATYRPLLDRSLSDPLRAELKWLGGELGAARDAEVVREHLLGQVQALAEEQVQGPVAERVGAELGAQLEQAQQHAVATLGEPRYFTLLDDLDSFLARPPLTEQAQEAPGQAAYPAVAHAVRRVRRAVRAAGSAQQPAERDLLMHEVRKAAKRARYAAESLKPVAGAPADDLADQMEAVQEVLGEHQDAVVVRGVLLDLARAGEQAGEPTFSYGVLHQLEVERGERTGATFAEVWRQARRRRHRRFLD